MSVPIDVLLQLLHERSFCAVPVANAIGTPESRDFRSQRRRKAEHKRRKARRENVGYANRRREKESSTSLADTLLLMAQAIVDKEDKERARKKEERAKKKANGEIVEEDEEEDIDDDDTFCDDITCRNTAINALNGTGQPVTEDAIAKKMAELKNREIATLKSLRLQRAMDFVLSEAVRGFASGDDEEDENEGIDPADVLDDDDDDDGDDEMEE